MTEKFLKIWKDSAFKDLCDNLFWGVSEAMGSLWFREGAEPGLVVQGLDSEHRMEEESTSVQVTRKGLSLWLSNLFQSMMTAFCLSVTRGKHRTELSLLRSSARGKTANTKPKASLWSCPFLIPSTFFSLSPLFLPPCLCLSGASSSLILAIFVHVPKRIPALCIQGTKRFREQAYFHHDGPKLHILIAVTGFGSWIPEYHLKHLIHWSKIILWGFASFPCFLYSLFCQKMLLSEVIRMHRQHRITSQATARPRRHWREGLWPPVCWGIALEVAWAPYVPTEGVKGLQVPHGSYSVTVRRVFISLKVNLKILKWG